MKKTILTALAIAMALTTTTVMSAFAEETTTAAATDETEVITETAEATAEPETTAEPEETAAAEEATAAPEEAEATAEPTVGNTAAETTEATTEPTAEPEQEEVIATAEPVSEMVVTLTIDNAKMTVNGEEQEIDPGRGTTPVIVNDRTLLPVRAVVEAFGGEVEWNEETREVTLTYGEDVIVLTIDSETATFNGEAEEIDPGRGTTPVIINDRTMLPIRYIAESFGLKVDWDGDTRVVTITRGAADTEEEAAEETTEETTNTTDETAQEADPDEGYDFKPATDEGTAEENEAAAEAETEVEQAIADVK